MTRCKLPLAGLLLALGAAGPATSPVTRTVHVFTAADPDQLRLALVTNNAADFWRLCQPEIARFERETGSHVDLVIPPSGTVAEQQRLLATAAADHDGVAVAPIDPTAEVKAIDAATHRANVLCWDSDSPTSDRLAFVGVDNVAAGEQVGRELVRLLPNGGRVGLFAGSFTAASAADRAQGIERAIAGHGLTITVRAADYADRLKATDNVQDAINAAAPIDAAVGLWSYEGPAIASAIATTGTKGRVKAICFDQEPQTLTAVRNGTIAATCVLDAGRMAYQTLTLLRDLARTGNAAKLPPDGRLVIPMTMVDATHLDADQQRSTTKPSKP